MERGQTLSDGSLVLGRLIAEDSGRYYCRVTSSVGTVQSREARLTVRERQERPEILHRPLQTRVVRGQRIVLDCLASGYPPPTYAWYKDGGRLSPAHDRRDLESDLHQVNTMSLQVQRRHQRLSGDRQRSAG